MLNLPIMYLTAKRSMEWNYEQTSTLIHFWKSNIDNMESPISNNIWAELKLRALKLQALHEVC